MSLNLIVTIFASQGNGLGFRPGFARFCRVFVLLLTSSAAVFANSSAQLIDIDFNLNSSVAHGGPNPGPTMSGAAVLGSAGDYWNGINAASGNAIPLTYANGGASSATLTFRAGGGYDVHAYGGSTPLAATPYDALVEDYLYNSGVPQTLTISGLASNSTYEVVAYNAADAQAAGRTTWFSVNGTFRASTWDGTNTSLVAGVDYVMFQTAVSDATGNLNLIWGGNGTVEGDLDGLQIQPASFQVSASRSDTNVSLSFVTQIGCGYQVQYKSALSDTNWTLLANFIPGNSAIQSVTDNFNGGSRFYRVLLQTNFSTGLSPLRANGTNLVNANGAIVHLRGLNLGSWLLMEKWMCPLDSGPLPDNYSVLTNLDYRCGVTVEQALIRSYQANWITVNDLNNLTNGGYNCLRVPVWWANFFSMTNTTSAGWRTDAFSQLDWLVTNCTVRGIYLVMDMHGVIGGQSLSQDCGQQNLNAYWTNALDQAQTAWLWTQIATHYFGNGTIAGYDLINEPVGAPNPSAVWSAYDSLYHAIRAVDPQHLIIMEGAFGSWNWSMLPNPATYCWANVAYSMHEYQYGGTAAEIEAGSGNQVTDFNNHISWNVPAYIGEWNDMGAGAAVYDYSTNAYDQAGMSWTMWAYKATDGLLPDGWGWYDPTYWPATPNISTSTPTQILSDWSQWKTTTSFGENSSVGL